MLLGVLVAGCGGGAPEYTASAANSIAATPAPAALCSVAQIESKMDALLAKAESEVDFSFAVERHDGRRYRFSRGGSTLQTLYESKSTSKLVTAVIILRLVEQGYLSLSDRPQDHIDSWPIGSDHALSGMTLAQLLSFPSGRTVGPPCLEAGDSDIESCVTSIADASTGNGITSGQEFFYASGHLQVAGLMAIEARDEAGWQAVFTEFQYQTGLFPASSYGYPSSSNPALAYGMFFTGEDYLGFLQELKRGQLLNRASMSQLLADHTASVPMVYSPIFSGIGGGAGLGEDWHYGFGLWHECQSPTFDCVAGTRVSSPGALGSYPFWDRTKGYTGIVVRAGEFGTTLSGIGIERSVRESVEQWAVC